METYHSFMDICEELAGQAASQGNARVGCVIVKDNTVIAAAPEAATEKADITAHAEIEAIRKARTTLGVDLSGTILVSTHEPCVMCAYAIRFHRIPVVVFRHRVPYLGSVSAPFPLLGSSQVPPHWAAPPRIIHLTS